MDERLHRPSASETYELEVKADDNGLVPPAEAVEHSSPHFSQGPLANSDRRRDSSDDDNDTDDGERLSWRRPTGALTPANTWVLSEVASEKLPSHFDQDLRTKSFGLGTGDIIETLDLSERPASLIGAVDEHLRHFQDQLLTVDEDQAGEHDLEPEDKHRLQVDEPPSVSPERMPKLVRSSSQQRSSSVPSKPRPLKSALATSPPKSPPENDCCHYKRKKAHFEDDLSASDLALRRTSTAPGRPESSIILSDDPLAAGPMEPTQDDSEPSGRDRAEDFDVEGYGTEQMETSHEDGQEADDSLSRVALDDDSTYLTPRAALIGDHLESTLVVEARVIDDRTPSTANDDKPASAFGHSMASEREGRLDAEESDSTEGEGTGDNDISVLLPSDSVRAAEDATLRKVASTSDMARDRHDHHDAGAVGPRRRASSMSSYTRQKGRLRFHASISAKAAPAECAITACSVRRAESPKLNTVYEHPAARYRQDELDKRPTKTAQTVVTPGSSTLQMVWEEPATSTSEDDVTLFEEPGAGRTTELGDPPLDTVVAIPDSPMVQVKSKLTAWSWEREQGEPASPHYLPLLDVTDQHDRRHAAASSPLAEYPPAPPNTTASSSNRGSHPSSARASAPQTPYSESDAEDANLDETEDTNQDTTAADDQVEEGDDPVELRIKGALSRFRSATVPTSSTDYMSIPLFAAAAEHSRRLSNLPEEDEHFASHRDSVDMYRAKHLRDTTEHAPRLQHTRDSFFITKSKFEARKFAEVPSGSFGWVTGGLSPILDSSPPDAGRGEGVQAMARAGEGKRRRGREEEHPLEHVGCEVCAVEWEKWFEARRRVDEGEEEGS
ncbi:hypothetical protein Tdes44962_MAKER01359 [Teratosphaeria destructans]|uniref:Uncharacterized protein n=1 Tax=Teratosphaeria destructans TaxID=418781 RepID=A0A9W7SZQ8_9PEZI|nr:hypothetical protein Tdes44962_MAKER01359 [Teratosphaeria destructans]